MSDDPKHPKHENKTPPKKPQEDLHRPRPHWTKPAGNPNAEERSRPIDASVRPRGRTFDDQGGQEGLRNMNNDVTAPAAQRAGVYVCLGWGHLAV